jgi:hypothetical protein
MRPCEGQVDEDRCHAASFRFFQPASSPSYIPLEGAAPVPLLGAAGSAAGESASVRK